MRGADRLIEALEQEGTDCIFGLPGGASLPIHDALHDSAIRHVLVRHEAGAGHAAEGYAKASGRVGVALVTSGPGATNLATPIADAHMDSVPTVFLCAQVRSDLRGTNAFQETDVLGMTLPISKHSIAVERADDAADAIHEAFHVARTGRPGPVVVDIPSDHARAPARAGNARRARPARLPHARRAQRAPAARGGAGDRGRPAAGALRRRRRRARGGGRRARGPRPARRPPGDDDAHGPRRLPGIGPPVARDARDARDPDGELGDGRGRPDRGGGRAVRRPRHRRPGVVRPARADRPHRRRRGGDRQERRRAHPGRRGRAPGAGGAARAPRRPGARPGAPRAVVAPPRRPGAASIRRARPRTRRARSTPRRRSTPCRRRRAGRPSSRRTSASTRCGRRTACGSTSRAAG